MAGYELPSLEDVRRVLVPSKITEEEFESKLVWLRNKFPNSTDSGLAVRLASLYGLPPTLQRGRRERKSVKCINDLSPGDYGELEVFLFNRREISREDGTKYDAYTAVDGDYCTFSLFDWEQRLKLNGHFVGVRLTDVLCRVKKDGTRMLSFGKFSRGKKLNSSFVFPPVKDLAEISHGELVRCRGEAIYGSLRISDSGVVRLRLHDSKRRWVLLRIYPEVVNVLKEKVDYSLWDKYSMEVFGIYLEKELSSKRTLSKGFVEKNFIQVLDIEFLEKVWDEEEEEGEDKVETDVSEQPQPRTPETSRGGNVGIDKDKVVEVLNSVFSLWEEWSEEELSSLLERKLGYSSSEILSFAVSEGILEVSDGVYRLKKAHMPKSRVNMEFKDTDAEIKFILYQIKECELYFNSGATYSEIAEPMKKKFGLSDEEIKARIKWLEDTGKIHKFGDKYRRLT